MTKPIGFLAVALVLIAAPLHAQVTLPPDAFLAVVDQLPAAAPEAAAPADQPAVHPAAIEYSHGYEVRARIHKYASYATLPLFAGELALGQSLYNSPGDGKKGAHVAIGAGIGGLFAVNTVTGVWNLIESRNDPSKRGIRLLHGLLMLGADAGFAATTAMAPSDHDGLSDDRSAHRTMAVTSIGLATASYLIMLFGGK
jgi:hypothetical protein